MTRSRTAQPVPPRVDGRAPDALRPVSIELDVAPAATGSALIRMGSTQVICAVTIEDEVPRWMKQQKVSGGWLTAEYSMLPYATETRNRREVSAGKVGGRTSEIQRLIGRAFRAAIDLEALGERTVWIDCDVLQADGGTRTASITGAYVALRRAIGKLMADGSLKTDPVREAVAAVSVGIVGGRPLLDLCYQEDAAAEVDMNVVMTASSRLIEVQGTAEEQPFTKAQMSQMMKLAERGIGDLLKAQQKALRGVPA